MNTQQPKHLCISGIACVLLFLAFCSSTTAQQWEKINYAGTSTNNMYTVYFGDSPHGCIGVNYIRYTSDAGKAWTSNTMNGIVPALVL